jgi:hypothetical protein
MGKLHATPERPVAADGDQAVDSMPPQKRGGCLQAFLCPESLTPAGMKDRAPAMDDIRDAAKVHLMIVTVERIIEVFLQQTLVASPNSDHIVS